MFQEVANQYLRVGKVEENTSENLSRYPKLLISCPDFWKWKLDKLNNLPMAKQKLTRRDSSCVILYHLPGPSGFFFFVIKI